MLRQPKGIPQSDALGVVTNLLYPLIFLLHHLPSKIVSFPFPDSWNDNSPASDDEFQPCQTLAAKEIYIFLTRMI
jgi:hypothetical protein